MKTARTRPVYALAATAWLAWAQSARADDEPDLAPWAVAGLEVGAAGVLAIGHLSGDFDDAQPAPAVAALGYALLPIATMAGGLLLADQAALQARGGNAIHGAWWGAVLGGAVGALWDGRGRGDIARGPVATGGAIGGLLLGASVGAWVIPADRTVAPWLMGPVIGAAGGAMISGLGVLLAQRYDVGRALAIGVAAGVAGGLTVGGVWAQRDAVGTDAARRGSRAPLTLGWQRAF